MSTWLPGYTYRKKGAVNATTAGAQALYQLKLIVGESSGTSGADVHCEYHCLDFPNDIRFTKEDGETKHDYWVEEITGTTPNRKATVWIQVTSIPASGSVDFYLYYRKSSDPGESDGNNTFEFYSEPNIPNYGTRESTNPVLEVASSGGYDDEDVFSPFVLEVNEADGKYYMYYNAEHNAGGADDYTTALAMSDDGITWTKYATIQPVIGHGSTGDFDEKYVYGATVVKVNSTTWHLWYAGQNNTNQVRIGHATSSDGKTWAKDANNPVLVGVASSWEVDVLMPMVLKDGSTWKMWYRGSDSAGRGKIGYATATNPNGSNWTKHGSNPIFERSSTNNWDAISVCNPFVLKLADNNWRLFFDAQTSGCGGTEEIGLAKSSDGITWTKIDDNPIYWGSADGGDNSEVGLWWECAGVGYRFSVLPVGSEYWAWYSAHTDHGVNAGYPDTAQIGLLKNVLLDQPSGFTPKWNKNRGLGGGGSPSYSQCLDFDNTNKRITGAYRRASSTDFIRDGTDIGTQHHAIWSPLTNFIAEWDSKLSDTAASQAGEGGIALIAADNTIIVYGSHADGSASSIAGRIYLITESSWTNVASGWDLTNFGGGTNNLIYKAVSSGDSRGIKIVKSGATSVSIYVDDEKIGDTTISSTVSKIALAAGGWGGSPYLDYVQIEDVKVRKYASPEPTWGSWASQEGPVKAFNADALLINPANKSFTTDAILSGKITGITRNSGGVVLGNCTVWLFKTSDKSYVDTTTSNASGEYSFEGILAGIDYFIRAFKDGTPNVFGTTDDNLGAT